MTLFGLTIHRKNTCCPATPVGPVSTQTLERSRGWFPLVNEPFAGAWQRNIVGTTENILTFAAVYACVTLKAHDIAKLRIKLMQVDGEGVWTETTNSAYSPVLRKPNHYQTRIQFLEQWMASKFIHGNTYALKQRDNRGGENGGNVRALYVLDPTRVKVQVAPDGSVFYALSVDPLSRLEQSVVVPASEIIHDLMCPLYHPLCGVSPLTACAVAALQGLRMQNHASEFAANGAVPSGTLSMPDEIDDDQAKEIQARWEAQFTGNNVGRVAVLGFGMKYEPMMMNAVDAELIKQLQWAAENVCTAHHVPPFMIGVGPPPAYNNIEALYQMYYAQALQNPIEQFELLMDEGLGMPHDLGVELDLDGLLRMDTGTKMEAAERAIKAGMSPDEVRKRFYDLGSVPGGENPLIQQQNFSLEALAKRDASDDPFGTKQPTPTPAPAQAPANDQASDKAFTAAYRKALMRAA